MRLFQFIPGLLLIILLLSCNTPEKQQPIHDFSELLQPVPEHAVLKDDGYYVWGGSAAKGKDGLYHLFYSRWKEEVGFNGWVTHSEIAHAVSESATGPFKFSDVALSARGAEYWDGLDTHNPTIHYMEGKYYLYYMGNTGDGKIMKEEYNFSHRNNQRIGVAWAETPNGPWSRLDKPVLDVSSDDNADDALMVSNPSVTVMRDGKILMVYKAVAKHLELPFGGPVTHQAAIGESPVGPFKKHNKRIFYKAGERFPAEDPFVWYHKSEDMYYGLVKDMHGAFTDVGQSIVFFKSKDGLSWHLSDNPLASKIEITWSNGKVEKLAHLERPQILFENGVPIMMYCAASRGSLAISRTFNVHIPLKMK